MSSPTRWFFSLLAVAGTFTFARASCLPEPSSRHLLYALSRQTETLLDVAAVESTLFAHAERGIQIVVIVTDTLCGLDIAMYANLIGEKWGVGTRGQDNGVVVVMVPKQGNRRGQLFVAPGRGIQGTLPDAYVKRLVDATIREYFVQGHFTEGLLTLVQKLAEEVQSEGSMASDEGEVNREKAQPVSFLAFLGKSAQIFAFLFWILFFTFSCLVWLYTTLQAGRSRYFDALWASLLWTPGMWLLIRRWLPDKLLLGLLLFLFLVSFLVGRVFLAPRAQQFEAVAKRVENSLQYLALYLIPAALLVMPFQGPFLMVLLLLMMLRIDKSQSGSVSPADEETDKTYPPEPSREVFGGGEGPLIMGGIPGSSDGGRPPTVTFGGGKFNGGGAGGSW